MRTASLNLRILWTTIARTPCARWTTCWTRANPSPSSSWRLTSPAAKLRHEAMFNGSSFKYVPRSFKHHLMSSDRPRKTKQPLGGIPCNFKFGCDLCGAFWRKLTVATWLLISVQGECLGMPCRTAQLLDLSYCCQLASVYDNYSAAFVVLFSKTPLIRWIGPNIVNYRWYNMNNPLIYIYTMRYTIHTNLEPPDHLTTTSAEGWSMQKTRRIGGQSS